MTYEILEAKFWELPEYYTVFRFNFHSCLSYSVIATSKYQNNDNDAEFVIWSPFTIPDIIDDPLKYKMEG